MLLKKILIVDDSRTARLMIIQHLMKAGLSRSLFVEAENGLSAADIIRRDKFDLIITDLLMPKMDGKTFIRKTRHLPVNMETPVIILSSIADNELMKELSELEKIYYLQKPLSEKHLSEILGAIKDERG